jgi:hypothetical protein
VRLTRIRAPATSTTTSLALADDGRTGTKRGALIAPVNGFSLDDSGDSTPDSLGAFCAFGVSHWDNITRRLDAA